MYFCVFLVPLILCCSYYIYVIFSLRENDVQREERELKHVARMVDATLEELSSLGDSLAGDAGVNVFKNVSDPFGYPHTYGMISLRDALPGISQMNNSVFGYYIFFDKSEIVLNDSIIYQYRDFYDLYLRESDSESYEAWLSERMLDNTGTGLLPAESYTFKDGEVLDLLIYVRPLLTDVDNSTAGRIWIALKQDVIDSLMPIIPEGGIQCIEDRENRIVYFREDAGAISMDALQQSVRNALEQDGAAEKISYKLDHDYYMFRYVSETSGLTYYSIQPERIVNQRTLSSIVALTVCISLAIFLGILLSYLMSLRSATPIEDILKEFADQPEYFEKRQSVFSNIKRSIQSLIKTNVSLSEALEDQKQYIKITFINQLIFGDIVDPAKAKRMAEYAEWDYKGRSFAVFIFRFRGNEGGNVPEELKYYSLSVQEALESVLPESLYTDIGWDQTALVLSYSADEAGDFKNISEKRLRQIKSRIPGIISDQISIYGGNLVNSLTDINKSYQNAFYMSLNEKGMSDGIVIWYLKTPEKPLIYPEDDFSAQLSYYLISGDQAGLHDELEKIIAEYILKSNLPAHLQNMILNELQIILLRALGHIEMDETVCESFYERTDKIFNEPLLVQITKVLDLYKDVCQYVKEQKDSAYADKLIPNVVAYIDMNYGDDNLSLKGVADAFHISEPYLSSVFKQRMGQTFSSYMEYVRMEKAKQFLRTTQMPINQIAEKVGYYSVNSFCRAFKRVTGTSASKYRKADSSE